ncbi:hypothetical protein [Caldifermentibacillus hisashii]|uniref:hypothetical protein n=1 Tax=Caldifermentibacillus hisashii TaxID=996558 RepID=UPI0030E8CE11
MATRPFLVVILSRETSFFDDETYSRRHFEAENALFWRRDLFSSTFRGEILPFLTTKLNLVTDFGRKTPFFGDIIENPPDVFRMQNSSISVFQ